MRSIFMYVFCIPTKLKPYSVLGASVKACKGLDRHVVALESEKAIYEEVLLPLNHGIDS